MRSTLAIWFTTACGTTAPGHDGRSRTEGCSNVFYADADGDGHGDLRAGATACVAPEGFTTTSDDCDDANAAIHTSASEVCNGLDDDCDGSIDVDAVDASLWYADADGDGFGDDAWTVTRCTMPAGFASAAGDCDDSEVTIQPDAAEICDGIDDDCDALVDELDDDLVDGSLWYADADNDGYGDPAAGNVACAQPEGTVANNDDCDDVDARVHPSIVEVCDGIDNDCDGLTDDADDGVVGQPIFYADTDGDGWGALLSDFPACTCPKGYVTNGDDCDDGTAAIGGPPTYYDDVDRDGYAGWGAGHATCTPDADDVRLTGDCKPSDPNVSPGAPEVCDRDDNDCDGLEDDADPSVAGNVYYADLDGDRYGTDADTFTACAPVAPYVARGGDCDDAIDTTYPGATEWCDAIDNDCDGTADDSPRYVRWYADDDGDSYGDSADWVPDCAVEGYVRDATDCDDSTASFSPSAPDVCFSGEDEDCDGYVDNCVNAIDAPLMRGTDRYERMGTSLAIADWNDDGVADVAAGGPSGAAGYVSVGSGPDLAAPVRITGNYTFGANIAGGDADGDGIDDLVAAEEYSTTSYLFLGPLTSDRAEADASATYTGDRLGQSLVVADDVDGDGGADVIIGAPYVGVTEPGQGVAYVVSGAASGAVSVATDATYQFYGRDDDSRFASSADDIGDVDGDGIDDMAFGAPNDNYWGIAWVVLGGLPPGSYELRDAGVTQAWTDGDTYSMYFGMHILGADYDDDGRSDLFVGTTSGRQDGFGVVSGAVFAYLSPIRGVLSADTAWYSDTDELALGAALAVEDVDGDGSNDVLMGAPHDSAGEVYVDFGKASGGVIEATSLSVWRGEPGDDFGSTIGIVPDWDGDGIPEVAVGAPGVLETTGTDGGAVYVIHPNGGP